MGREYALNINKVTESLGTPSLQLLNELIHFDYLLRNCVLLLDGRLYELSQDRVSLHQLARLQLEIKRRVVAFRVLNFRHLGLHDAWDYFHRHHRRRL